MSQSELISVSIYLGDEAEESNKIGGAELPCLPRAGDVISIDRWWDRAGPNQYIVKSISHEMIRKRTTQENDEGECIHKGCRIFVEERS